MVIADSGEDAILFCPESGYAANVEKASSRLPEAPDGGEPREIPAWVYRPEGEGPFPVVVSIHGGPEAQSRPWFSSTYQMWLAKLGVAIVVTPVGILLFRFDLSAAPLGFIVVMALGLVGFGAVGTLFAAAVTSSRLQGGLLAMLVFPLSLPIVLASTQLMVGLFEQDRPLGAGVGVLVAFDIVFLVASWLVFEFLLEP